MDKKTIKGLIVIAALCGAIIGLGAIGQPWWWGFVLLACIFGVGLPIGLLLILWIEKN